MKNNDRLFKLSVTLTGALIIVGFAFLSHIRLDSPVFLEHDITLEITGENNFSDTPVSLNYITNAHDNRIVTWVEFRDYPDLEVGASENEFTLMSAGRTEVQSFDDQWGRDFGQYNVRNLYIEVRQLPDLEEGEDLVLSEATVTYSDGTSQVVDIGEMTISYQEVSDSPLRFSHSFSASTNESSATYDAEEELAITDINIPRGEGVSDLLQLEVNGMDYQEAIGQTVQAGQRVSVSVTSERFEDYTDFKVYRTSPEFILSNNEDEHTVTLAQTIQIEPDYSFLAIYRYLRAREDS